MRRVLVVAQVSLSLVLLVGALLFVRSLQKLLAVDGGFRPEGVTTVHLDLRPFHYSKERLPLAYREMLSRIRSAPGIVSAAQVMLMPIGGGGWDETTWAEDSPSKRSDCFFNRVSPSYFRTMGTSLVSGRDFNDRDGEGNAKIAIVNEEFARVV